MRPDYVIHHSDYAKPIKRFKYLHTLLKGILVPLQESERAAIEQLQKIHDQMQQFHDTNMQLINDLLKQIKELDRQLLKNLQNLGINSGTSSGTSSESVYYAPVSSSETTKPETKRGALLPIFTGFSLRLFRRKQPSDDYPVITHADRLGKKLDTIESLNQRITNLKIEVAKFHPTMLMLCDAAEASAYELDPTLIDEVPSGGDYRLALT